MYNRAKYHPNRTKQMEEAMRIFESWLKKYPKLKAQEDKDYPWLPLKKILEYEKIAETYGVSRDVTRGLELLARGVELGSRECAYNLGCLYKAGKDVAVDDRKAAYYLGIAYLARHEHAHRLLILLQQTSKLDFSAEIAAAKRQIDEWELIRLSQSDNH
jgi:TPR repeat protein